MKSFFRRLFCLHKDSTIFIRNIYGDEIYEWGKNRSLHHCTRCNSTVPRPEIYEPNTRPEPTDEGALPELPTPHNDVVPMDIHYDVFTANQMHDYARAAQAMMSEPMVLKGVGKVNGDGVKDTTKVDGVVIGNASWAASTEQYDFLLATLEEIIAYCVQTVIQRSTTQAVEDTQIEQDKGDHQ